MKKIIFLMAATLIYVCSYGQNVAKVTISGNGNFASVAFALDENVFVYVNKYGSIANWGYDRFAAMGQENYAETVQPYVGRVEYYSDFENEAFRGKVKYIGRTSFTYYASYENESLRGKLKSVGTITFSYYDDFEDEAVRGAIKNMGTSPLTWYSSFENEGFRGKLKSLSSTQLTYYASYEDKAYRGKVKSIGNAGYSYYSSFDLPQYRGGFKTGTQIQYINGLKYYVRF